MMENLKFPREQILTSSPGPPPGASCARLSVWSGGPLSQTGTAEWTKAWPSWTPALASPSPSLIGAPPSVHTHRHTIKIKSQRQDVKT